MQESDILEGLAVLGRNVRLGDHSSVPASGLRGGETSLVQRRARERSLVPPWRLQTSCRQESPVAPPSSDRVRGRERSVVPLCDDTVRGRERSLSPPLSSRRSRKRRKYLGLSSDDGLLAPWRRDRRSPRAFSVDTRNVASTSDAPVLGRARSILPPSDASVVSGRERSILPPSNASVSGRERSSLPPLSSRASRLDSASRRCQRDRSVAPRREEYMRRSPNAPPVRVTPIPNLHNVQDALQRLMDATIGRDLSFADPHFVDRGTDALIYFPIQDGLQKVAQEALDVHKAGRVELFHGTTPLSCITILKSGALKKMDQDGVVLTNDLLACRNSHYNKGVILRCDAYIQYGQPDNYNTVARRAQSADWRSQYLSEAGHALHQRDCGFSKIWVNERSVEIRGLYVALRHWESIWAAWNRFINKKTRIERRSR